MTSPRTFLAFLMLPLLALAELRLDFPAPSQWKDATHVEASFHTKAELPADTMATVFSKDNDHLWRQIRMACPRPDANGTFTITVPILGSDAVAAWTPCGHKRPWTSLTVRNLVQAGIIFSQDKNDGIKDGIECTGIKAVTLPLPPRAPAIPKLDIQPASPVQGDTVEVSFQLDCWPSAPFDSAKTDIRGTVRRPDGATDSIRGFYYEGFLYDARDWDKTRCLTPYGAPCFKLRYCPSVPGPHNMSLSCVIDGVSYKLPTAEFQVGTAPFKGFIRRDAKHNQYFAYDDGSLFWGLGLNVRSPYDNRYKQIAPYSNWQDMGLSAYDHLFKRYKEKNINLVEVWMCSWWLALEWINDAPGFHGVGHYNPYRAWMLDHIFKLARRYDINLILVINNHGKFGMTYDTEWSRNPYNKANGGYLDKCEEYYTNPRAREDTRRLLDYITARWGATPNLFAWKLFTEVDLTGPTLQYHRDPAVARWHSEMGAYLKKIDPYKHLVTTHWMLNFHNICREIAVLPELDFPATDAYYQGGGGEALYNLLRASRDYALSCSKPLVITEFGGSSYGDHMANLIKQVPLGLWTGFFNEMGVLPMYWWFALLEDQNLYHHYQALTAFGASEDRRTMAPSTTDDGPLKINILKAQDRLLAWIFDKEYVFSQSENTQPALRSGATITLPAPTVAGNYNLEFWDADKGCVIATTPLAIASDANTFSAKLPDFKQHLALKLVKK